MAVWICLVLCLVLCLHALLFCQAIPGLPSRVLNYSLSPFDPYTLEYHLTRYAFGCFIDMYKYRKTYPYNMIMPFVYNFDYILAPCHINWRNISLQVSNVKDDCLLKVIKHPNITDVYSNLNDGILRVSISNTPSSIKKFIDDIYNHFYKQKQKIILHIGIRDGRVTFSELEKIIDSPIIVRFVIEQSIDVKLTHHPKVLYLPIGLCFREDVVYGDDLRRVINAIDSNISSNSSVSSNSSISIKSSIRSNEVNDTATSRTRKLLSDSMSSLGISLVSDNNRNISSSNETIDSHRVLHELAKAASGSIKWEDRKDRIFICFSHNYKRIDYINWGLHNCTVCDVCNYSETLHRMEHIDLWMEYTKYKYIMSPYGNAPDCFRSWEIMLLGAIPLIQYFEGANGYLQGNLTAILVHKPQELTAANISVWNKRYNSGTPPERLTRKYWNDRAFGL